MKAVAAVCDKQVRIFGELTKKNTRPLTKIINFPTHGAALFYAQEHDDYIKENQNK